MALIKYLITHYKESHQQYIRGYLTGDYYTAADRELLVRNLKNKLTKDIVVGFNQRINWSVVNEAVEKMEPKLTAICTLQAKAGLNLLDFYDAVAVIKKRFLNDENLCVEGARWILTNHDLEKNGPLDFSDLEVNNGEVVNAVALFLKTYYSPDRDYGPYMLSVDKLKENEAWLSLLTLKAQFVEKDKKASKAYLNLTNPNEDRYLDTLLNNIKNRFQLHLQPLHKAT